MRPKESRGVSQGKMGEGETVFHQAEGAQSKTGGKRLNEARKEMRELLFAQRGGLRGGW